jgi:hypothetical protein
LFNQPVDIANRALQHVGTSLIATLADDDKGASEISFCYDKLRRAELRRNVWRFATRRAVLYPINTISNPTGAVSGNAIPTAFSTPTPAAVLPTMLLVPAVWNGSTHYPWGTIIQDAAGNVWQSTLDDNFNHQPGSVGDVTWDTYFGSMCVQPFSTDNPTGKPTTSNAETAYFVNDLVYEVTSTTVAYYGPELSSQVYVSLQGQNNADPSVPTSWDATTIFQQGNIVQDSSLAYWESLVDFNCGNVPSTSPLCWTAAPAGYTGSDAWLPLIGATMVDLNIQYPIGSGPSIQTETRNVFMLPNAYLRTAPQDPKAGSVSFLGAPSNLGYEDWEFEGNFIVSRTPFPIIFRFVADVTLVPKFDDMFCEGLAARIGMEICEAMTQSNQKIGTIASAYNKFMTEARMVNGIETGSVEPPMDSYIQCRI